MKLLKNPTEKKFKFFRIEEGISLGRNLFILLIILNFMAIGSFMGLGLVIFMSGMKLAINSTKMVNDNLKTVCGSFKNMIIYSSPTKEQIHDQSKEYYRRRYGDINIKDQTGELNIILIKSNLSPNLVDSCSNLSNFYKSNNLKISKIKSQTIL